MTATLWRGSIVEVHAGGFCSVSVPRLLGDEVMSGVPVNPAITVTIGDRVLVGCVEDNATELVVLMHARAPETVPGPGLFTRVTITDPPLEDTDAATVAWVRAQLPPPTP